MNYFCIVSFILATVNAACDNVNAACTVRSLTTTTGSKAKIGPFCPGDLIFEEKFDTLDSTLWVPEVTMNGGGNSEFQTYTNHKNNSFVQNGYLIIKPTLLSDEKGEAFLSSGTIDLNAGTPANQCTASWNNGCKRTGTVDQLLPPIKSAKLRTQGKFAFKYGKVEINAKVSTGDWLWPALWLMPDSSAYGQWPASGEIDMAETRGNRNLTSNGGNIGVQQVASTLHFGPSPAFNGFLTATYAKNLVGSGWNDQFHKYQLDWSPDYLIFSVDGVVYGKVDVGTGFWARGNFSTKTPGTPNPWINGGKAAPFDKEFFFIFDLAVGGINYFPDKTVNAYGPKPWLNNSTKLNKDFWSGKSNWLPTWKLAVNNSAEASLQVDYVRVWAL